MSRLAKKPIIIPEGVTVTLGSTELHVKGPKGERVVPMVPFAEIKSGAEGLSVATSHSHTQARANVGTMWSLTRNAVLGVREGFTKVLEIEGVGYRAALEGNVLSLSLGYVNPVKFPVPDGITMVVEKNVITISGIDKDLVGRTASQIRSLKKPEPY